MVEEVARIQVGQRDAWFGLSLIWGNFGNYRVRMNKIEGAKWLGVAAERGSDMAALLLGFLYANGLCGFDKNVAQAIELFNKGLDGACLHKHASSVLVEQARGKLV